MNPLFIIALILINFLVSLAIIAAFRAIQTLYFKRNAPL